MCKKSRKHLSPKNKKKKKKDPVCSQKSVGPDFERTWGWQAGRQGGNSVRQGRRIVAHGDGGAAGGRGGLEG